MIKNLFLLGLLTVVTMSYAKTKVVHDSLSEAETFKVEKPAHEQEATRGVAGSKIKKKKGPQHSEEMTPSETATDSEVRYWKYSEE